MRRAARIDDNQQIIVAALRAVGASVQSLAAVGKGCPDLAVAYRGVNYFLEVKDGSKPASRQVLTTAEAAWHQRWKGPVAVVSSISEALAAIGAQEAL